MLGHKWESAQGVIVEAQAGPPAGRGAVAALHPAHQYLIEVRRPAGDVLRGTVIEKSMFPRQVGATVSVEVNPRTSEIRLDPKASRMDSFRGMMNMVQQVQNPAGPATAAGGAAGLAGLVGGLGAGHSEGTSVHVANQGGQEIPAHMRSEEIRDLAQAIMSGDPAARQAAIQRMRQIKAQAQQQATSPQADSGTADPGAGVPPLQGSPGPAEGFSGSSGPSTFDDIGTSRTSGQAMGAFGEPAGFGQPVSPDPYRPISPPPAATFGSFDTGPGQGTREQQLARLRELLGKGILTESEYEAQRQRVINGL